jgi:hypothetical protein
MQNVENKERKQRRFLPRRAQKSSGGAPQTLDKA